ncbi:MAG: ABC transporter permease [Clostridia bacterium]
MQFLLCASSADNPFGFVSILFFIILKNFYHKKDVDNIYFIAAFKEAMGLIISLQPELYGTIFLSLRVTFTALFFAALIGIPLGVLLGLYKFAGKKILVNIINTFMSVPPVVVGLIVYMLLSNETGLVGDNRLLFTPFAMILAQFALALPLMVGLTYAGISNVDPLAKRSAISLGASPTGVAFTVIREARFVIYSSFIVVFGRLLAEVGAVMMVGGNIRYQTRMMTTSIAMLKGMGEFQTALALGMILLLISFVINGLMEVIRNYGRNN